MTKDIFWREKGKFGENSGMPRDQPKEKKKKKKLNISQ